MSLRVKSDTYTGQTEWVAIPVIHVINVQTSNDSPFFSKTSLKVVTFSTSTSKNTNFTNDGTNFRVYQENGKEKVRLYKHW